MNYRKKKKRFSEAHDNVAYEVHTEKIISHQNGVRTEKKSLSKKENTSNFMDTENVENNEEMARQVYLYFFFWNVVSHLNV